MARASLHERAPTPEFQRQGSTVMAQPVEEFRSDAREAEILLYPRIRKSPHFYAHRRHGVKKYSVYNHH